MSGLVKRIDALVNELIAIRAIVAKRTNVVDGQWTCKTRYTGAEAEIEKAAIEDAFVNGFITYDKKRGLKRVVTVRTQ